MFNYKPYKLWNLTLKIAKIELGYKLIYQLFRELNMCDCERSTYVQSFMCAKCLTSFEVICAKNI